MSTKSFFSRSVITSAYSAGEKLSPNTITSAQASLCCIADVQALIIFAVSPVATITATSHWLQILPAVSCRLSTLARSSLFIAFFSQATVHNMSRASLDFARSESRSSFSMLVLSIFKFMCFPSLIKLY